MILSTEQQPPRIGLESTGIRMTPAEFDALEDVDENYNYELVHGVLIVSPPTSEQERSPNELLGYWLLYYQEHHDQGAAMNATLPEHAIYTLDSRRRADRVIWTGLSHKPHPTKDIPAIAIELVSPGRRDRYRDYIEKRQEYLAIGVKEYWIIDRFRRSMTVYKGVADAPLEQVVAESETYQTDLLPGFELPLAKLLAAADQWKESE